LDKYIFQNPTNSEIENILYPIAEELDECDETFRELYMIMKRVEVVFKIYKSNLGIIEEFAHGVIIDEGKVAQGIEAEFEAFREKYNMFLNDFEKFCHKVNQETGGNELPEYVFERIEKW